MWLLAWRNIWRKKWRSLLTAFAVGVVVYLTLIYFGMVGASQNGMYQSISQNAGHIQVRVAGYRDIRDFDDLLLADVSSLVTQVSTAVAEITTEINSDIDTELIRDLQVSTALEVPGLLEGDGRSRGIVLQGIDQTDSGRERYAEEYLEAGRLPTPGDLESIALGNKLATALGVELGDTVYMYAPGTEGYGAAAFTVTGLLNIAGAETFAVSSLLAAQDVGAPEDASRVELYFPNLRRFVDDPVLDSMRDQLVSALAGAGVATDALEVELWREVDPSISSYLASSEGITTVITGLFFVLAGLLVMNTVYLSVMERIKEFGVMIALGTKRRNVVRMMLGESLFICAVGASVGGVLGMVSLWRMAQGFTFPGMEELFVEYGLPATLYASISPDQIVITVVFTVLTGILAALFPAFTAARLEPVEAMRFSAA
jgi:ABC-type lipoprotein release transport system permease subunit